MSLIRRACVIAVVPALILAGAPSAHAGGKIPSWAKPAVDYLADNGWIERAAFKPNRAMARADFKTLMKNAFGGGYNRSKGYVSAGEVSKALVKALGKRSVAEGLVAAQSPDGWTPERASYFGFEITAREMSLRHDRPTSEDKHEASATERMKQADIAWSVWKAKTAPSLWGADALASFEFDDYDATRRQIVQYALSLVGTPYVWAGEWPETTPSGYPYGAQVHGGFDCSGFIWYVLRKREKNWSPIDRPYKGWDLAERSSYQMAKATPKTKRLGYRKLTGGDIVFFAPKGKDSKPADVYHAGLYLGTGWMIHSSGSRAGVSISSIAPGSWWHGQIIFGRRLITE